jgi:hypothetical protein
MTIDKLASYNHLKKEIEQIDLTIYELEKTIIGSSKINDINISSGRISNPTEQLGLKLSKLKEKLISKKEDLLEKFEEIETFLATVTDLEVLTIIRIKYINCKSWNDVANELYIDRTTAYKKVKSYLEKVSVNNV